MKNIIIPFAETPGPRYLWDKICGYSIICFIQGTGMGGVTAVYRPSRRPRCFLGTWREGGAGFADTRLPRTSRMRSRPDIMHQGSLVCAVPATVASGKLAIFKFSAVSYAIQTHRFTA